MLKNYVRKVPLTNEEQWFLPHFPVIKEDRTTTKVRIVYDAAAKDEGKCLNDAILSGPKLRQDLVDALIRFRSVPVAISADISQMFLQVQLKEEDRPYHRFLWRNFDQSKPPDVYEFQRLPFGNTASPFCAQYILHSHARSHAETHPEAADTVENSMYVDDVLDSRETTQEAKNLRRELSDMLSGAGFDLRKWLSNEVEVIEEIPSDNRLPGMEITDKSLPTLKTLGLLWKSQEDAFTFKVKQPKEEDPTKRNVLSAIATLFDPLQLLAPFTLRAKVLMQEIWTAGLDWDDTLPDNLKTKWNVWINEHRELSNFHIPRCIRLPDPIETQLHVFSDASKDAYAAAAYLLCKYNCQNPTCYLIASKSRVSPIKAVTIPRLELMGGILSARLAKNIRKTLTVGKTTFWTDSTNVLYWVRSKSRSFKPFVANRVGEIQRITDPEEWRHIPGVENPADLPTRGLTASQITESKLWIEGPEFLKSDESCWPEKLPNNNADGSSIDVERRKEQTHNTGSHVTVEKPELLDPSKFSSLTKLYRTTAWIKRFVGNCRLSKESRNITKILQPDEMKKAERIWLGQAQIDAFPDGEKDKRLLHFNPKRDEEGLLRADGRLRFARELPYDTRHPILLPKDHPVTKLIIVDAHKKRGHGTGVEHLLTELRSKYWVVKGRRAVRNVVETCPGCRRRFVTKQPGQMMAPLPGVRVKLPLKAFDRIGVDYGRPFRTKQGRGKPRAKRYLCLFTCLATRAVHMEMSYSLDTDSFLNAFTRMTSRRGMPSYVVSDNGGNFVSGEKEIRELVSQFDQEKIINETSRMKPIEWKFNPPASPHFGGIFESMIKSSKKALRTILGDAEVNDEELHTAICGAERLLNSRPITYVSSDINDLAPLTPSHFLVGQLGGDLAPEVPENETVNPKKRWRRIQQLLGQFWRRWRREFLPSLSARGKWFQKRKNLKEGDVVLLIEPNAKRGEWPLARVVEAHPGKDGLVRVVKIQIGDSTYLRPVHHLSPLEVEGAED